MNKEWHKFIIKSDGDGRDDFEKKFCKKLFALQNDIDEYNLKFPKNLEGIECEPINGISFQSKFFTSGFSQTQVIESLKKIYYYHSTTFPELKKVYFYINEEISSTFLRYRLKPEGYVYKLKEEKNVEVIFEYEIVDNILIKPKYQELKEFFNIGTQDNSLTLKLLERYIDSLDFNIAEELLNNLELNVSKFSKDDKYKFYICKGKFHSNYNAFGSNSAKKTKDFGKYLVEAFEYKQDNKARLNKAIGHFYNYNFLEQNTKEELNKAQDIIDDLVSNDFSITAYSLLLHIKYNNNIPLDEIENGILEDYKLEQELNNTLGNLEFLEGRLERAIEYYNKIQDKTITQKINYINIKSQVFLNKYSFSNLSLEGKENTEMFFREIDDIEGLIKGKTLEAEASIYNIKAIIYSNVYDDIEKSKLYFSKSLELDDINLTKVNYALCLIKHNVLENAIDILKEVCVNIEYYKKNNNENLKVIFQAPILLSQSYQIKKDLKSARNILEQFQNNYNEYFDDEIKLKFNLEMLNILGGQEKIDFLNNLLKKEPDNFEYNLSLYTLNKDISILDKALKNYLKLGIKQISNGGIILAKQLEKIDRGEEAFNIYKDNLLDFKQKLLVSDFILLGIKLGKFDEVLSIIDNYIKYNGSVDELSIYYKAFLYDEIGKYKEALDILNENKAILNSSIILLLYNAIILERDDFEKNNEKITSIILFLKENFSFEDFNLQNKSNFLYFYARINNIEALKFCYNFAQDYSYIYYHRIFFGLVLNIQDYGNNEEISKLLEAKKVIDNNSVVILTDKNSNLEIKYILDGYSQIEGIKTISDKDDVYDLLIGKTIGEYVLLNTNKYIISGILNKYSYFYNTSSVNLHNEGIIKIFKYNEDEGPEQIVRQLSEINSGRADLINLGKKLYKDGNLSYEDTSLIVGKNYLDTFKEITINGDFSFISDQHFKVKDFDVNKSIFIDVTSILAIFELGLENVILNLNLKVSLKTFEFFKKEKYDILQANKDLADKIYLWINSNCQICTDKSLLGDSKLSEKIGKTFYDTLILSSNSGDYIYSEDLFLRKISRTKEFNIFAFGSEIFIEILYFQKLVSSVDFINLKVKLLKLNYKNLFITTGFIYYIFIHYNNIYNHKLDLIFKYLSNNSVNLNFYIELIIFTIYKLSMFYEFKEVFFMTSNLVDIIGKYKKKNDLLIIFDEVVMKESLIDLVPYRDIFN